MEKKYILSEDEHLSLIEKVFGTQEYIKIMPLVVLQGRIKIYSVAALNSNEYSYIDFTDYDVHIVLNGLDDSQKDHLAESVLHIIEQEEEYFAEKERVLFEATTKYKIERFGNDYKIDFAKHIEKVDNLREEFCKKQKERFNLSCKMAEFEEDSNIAELEEQAIILDNEIADLQKQIEKLEKCSSENTATFELECE